MPPQNVQRKLTAILSADVKGYSRLMADDEVATVRTLTTYREVMMPLLMLPLASTTTMSPGWV